MLAHREAPPEATGQPDWQEPPEMVEGFATLLRLCPDDGGSRDERLRTMLTLIRQARIMEIRAIEDYLGLRPRRGRGV